MINRTRALLLLIVMVFASGCAHQQRPLPEQDWQQRERQLNLIRNWQISGKLGIRVPGDNGSATLNWKQSRQDYRIDLSGPMGSGRMAIDRRNGIVTLTTAGEEPQQARSGEELILAHTGWTIPVAQLIWWVRALPAPNEPISAQAFTDNGQLQRLEQAGWTLDYSNYQAVYTGNHNQTTALPGRIVAAWGDIRLTLIIREWHLGE